MPGFLPENRPAVTTKQIERLGVALVVSRLHEGIMPVESSNLPNAAEAHLIDGGWKYLGFLDNLQRNEQRLADFMRDDLSDCLLPGQLPLNKDSVRAAKFHLFKMVWKRSVSSDNSRYMPSRVSDRLKDFHSEHADTQKLLVLLFNTIIAIFAKDVDFRTIVSDCIDEYKVTSLNGPTTMLPDDEVVEKGAFATIYALMFTMVYLGTISGSFSTRFLDHVGSDDWDETIAALTTKILRRGLQDSHTSGKWTLGELETEGLEWAVGLGLDMAFLDRH